MMNGQQVQLWLKRENLRVLRRCKQHFVKIYLRIVICSKSWFVCYAFVLIHETKRFVSFRLTNVTMKRC